MKNIKTNLLLLLLISIIGTSCQYFKKNVDKTPVAKIYDTYLYFEDIDPTIYKNKKPEDSLEALHNFIEKWSYNTLLIKEAERNLDTSQISRLTEQYRQDLLKDTYKELLLQKYIDSVIPEDSLQHYYQVYKPYFTADQSYLQAKYLVVNKKNPKVYQYKKWFFSDNADMSDNLIKHINAFKKYDFEGEKWLSISDFKKNIPVLKNTNEKYILKKRKKFSLTDSLSLYLVFVKDFVKKDMPLPLDLAKNNLNELILNKRKKAALSTLEQNIKQEAINKKILKIYKTKQPNE
ncbi:MAG TPA: hypothetical protein ENK67_07650 [Flavobacteriia bacterium]|nr:hypothetical protein [Flavobacteriia bacterium]